MERPRPPLRELCAESVAADVCHAVLFGKGRDSTGRILSVQCLAEKDEVRKASADRELRLLERFKICLEAGQSLERQEGRRRSYMSSDQV